MPTHSLRVNVMSISAPHVFVHVGKTPYGHQHKFRVPVVVVVVVSVPFGDPNFTKLLSGDAVVALQNRWSKVEKFLQN